MRSVFRKFKWYDWIPIVGWITTHWGTSANGADHFTTFFWFFWQIIGSMIAGVFLVIGLLFLIALI